MIKHTLPFLVMLGHLMAAAQNRIPVQLFDPDPGIGSCYGRSVAILRDYVFVGEPDPDGQGRIHVFHRNSGGLNNWGWLQTILPPDNTAGLDITVGKDFGHLCIAGNGNLVVLRPRRSVFINQIEAWRCFDNMTLVYKVEEDGYWNLDLVQGGFILGPEQCFFGGGSCWDFTTPVLSGSEALFARSQANLDVGTGSGAPVAVPGVTTVSTDSLDEEPTLLFWGSSRALAVTGDTVITEGLRLYTAQPPLLLDSIALLELAPNLDLEQRTNPLSAQAGVLAVGNRFGDSLGPNSGNVLLFDLGTSPPTFTGMLLDSTPASGRRFGTDVELKGAYMAVLGQDSLQPAVIELLQHCTSGSGWCPLEQYPLQDPSPIVPDAFRMSQNGEFVVTTAQGVYLYFDPGIALHASTGALPSSVLDIISVDQHDLRISVPQAFGSGTLHLLDAQGRIILERSASIGITTIPVGSMPSGLYIARYSYRSGVSVSQFMKP